MRFHTVLGIALIVAGGIMALFWNVQIGWFQCGPFGLLIAVLGAVDVFEGSRRAKGKKPKSLLDDFREDFGGGKSRSNDDDRSR